MTDIAYKVVLLLKRRPDLTPEAFADAWLELAVKDPVNAPGLDRQVFDRPVVGQAPIANAPAAPYDAAEEYWFETKALAADWFLSRAFADHWLPPRLKLLDSRPDAVGGAPQVIWERSAAADPKGAVKVIVLPVALRKLTVQQFVQHWTGPHAELALAGPDTKERLLRIEDTPAATTPTPFGETRYDGVGAITFESAEALAAEFSSDYYREHLAPDEPRFTDPVFSGALLTSPVSLR